MAPAQPSLDIVSVAIALSSRLFGPDTAQLVGPYAVIFLGAVLGAAVSASRQPQQEKAPRFTTFYYILLMVVASLLVTVPCSTIAASYLPGEIDAKFLFAPVAFVISLLGPDGWASAAKWGVNLIRDLIQRKVGAPPTPPNDQPPPGGTP